MARYIDLDKVEFLKVNGNKEFNHGVDCCINKLLKIEPADVVERSKIDEAIEEINNAEVEVDFMNEHASAFNSGLFKALEILKRNIGE